MEVLNSLCSGGFADELINELNNVFILVVAPCWNCIFHAN